MGNGRGQFNVAHALAAYLGAGYFNAASFTDDAFEAHALVLTAVALPVPGRTEDLFTEKTVLLRLEGAVVDGDRKSTRLNSSHVAISYAVFCLKKKKKANITLK